MMNKINPPSSLLMDMYKDLDVDEVNKKNSLPSTVEISTGFILLDFDTTTPDTLDKKEIGRIDIEEFVISSLEKPKSESATGVKPPMFISKLSRQMSSKDQLSIGKKVPGVDSTRVKKVIDFFSFEKTENLKICYVRTESGSRYFVSNFSLKGESSGKRFLYSYKIAHKKEVEAFCPKVGMIMSPTPNSIIKRIVGSIYSKTTNEKITIVETVSGSLYLVSTVSFVLIE